MSVSLKLVSGSNSQFTYHVSGKGISGKVTWDRKHRQMAGATYNSATMQEICNQLSSMIQKSIDSLVAKYGNSDPEINILIRNAIDEVKALRTLGELRSGRMISFYH